MLPADPDSAERRAVRRASYIAIPVMSVGFVLMVAEVVISWHINQGEVSSLVIGVLISAFMSAVFLGLWLQCAAAAGRRWGKSESADKPKHPSV